MGSSSTSVCTRKIAIEDAVRGDMRDILRNLPKALVGDYVPRVVGRNGMGDELRRARPSWTSDDRRALRTATITFAMEKVWAFAQSFGDFDAIDTAHLSNASFLAALGAKRDFKAGCAVCLTDEIMGTTCTCGHTEIACFRPCGHTVCASPCFAQMMDTAGHDGHPTVNVNGREVNIVLKVETANGKGMSCPLCRATIETCFRIEEASFNAAEFEAAGASGFGAAAHLGKPNGTPRDAGCCIM